MASRSLPVRRVPYPYPLFAACVRKVSSSPQPHPCYTGIVAQAKTSRFHTIGSSPAASTLGHLFSRAALGRVCVPGVASTRSSGPSLIGRCAGLIAGPLPPVALVIGRLRQPLIFTMDKRYKANSPGNYWMLVACKPRALWAKRDSHVSMSRWTGLCGHVFAPETSRPDARHGLRCPGLITWISLIHADY